MLSNQIKWCFNEAFFNCNILYQFVFINMLGVLLFIFRQFDYTYAFGVNKYVNDIKGLLIILPLFCSLKILYDNKWFKLVYFCLLGIPILLYVKFYSRYLL